MKYQLSLPLGSTTIQHPHGEFKAAQVVFGDFTRMTFQVKRSSLTAYEVDIHHAGVLGARQTRFDYDEVIGGLIGDRHTLLYGRLLTFVRADEDGGLTIEVE